MLCVIALTGLMYIDSIENMEDYDPSMTYLVGDEIIDTYVVGDKHYLFLPSWGIVNGGVDTEDIIVMKSENLPSMHIWTDSGNIDKIWNDKEAFETGRLRIYDTQGEKLYSGGLKSVNTRGNYSFTNYEKKPLGITTKDVVSLLGLGKGNKYVLIPNASDPTLLRNHIARKMESALGVEYDNLGEYLDLYINGEYLGNYYLVEKIEIGEERINITNLEAAIDLLHQKSGYEAYEDHRTEDARGKIFGFLEDFDRIDITGGYLIEREFEDRYKIEYEDNPSSFVTAGGEHFWVDSPRYCSVEQIEYIKATMDRVEELIMSSDEEDTDTLAQYIDMDSWAKKYIIEEFTKNYDAGVSSTYFYKDSDKVDGRIKAGPVWDMDMSMGNYLEWMADYCEDPTGLTKLSEHDFASSWYAALYERPEYYDRVVAYYRGLLSPYVDELIKSEIDKMADRIAASAGMNEIRWAVDYENNIYYTDRESSLRELKEYILLRKEFLDNVWE